MKNIFKLMLIFISCTTLKAQTVGFRDESKTDEAFYLTITEFSKLIPGDDWKKFFSDSVYYLQASDGQRWVSPSALQKLIAPLGNEGDLLKFFLHHFKYGFRNVNDSSADNDDSVFENDLQERKTFCTYPFVHDSLIRNGECNCVLLRDATIYELPHTNSKIISTIKKGCCNIGMHELVSNVVNPFTSWWKIEINETTGYILSDSIVPNTDYLVRIYWTFQKGKWKISIIYLPAGC